MSLHQDEDVLVFCDACAAAQKLREQQLGSRCGGAIAGRERRSSSGATTGRTSSIGPSGLRCTYLLARVYDLELDKTALTAGLSRRTNF